MIIFSFCAIMCKVCFKIMNKGMHSETMANHLNLNKPFKYPIHSVENAFSILEILAENGLELGIADLCKKNFIAQRYNSSITWHAQESWIY